MRPISRRVVLRGCAALGPAALTLTGTSLGTASAAGVARHLVLDYRPSQPTGWPDTPGISLGTTLGGYINAKDFTYNGTPHQVSVLGDGRGPTYADVPSDPELNYQDVLQDTFGAHYAFRYQGGFPGKHELRVQSYGVFAQPATESDPATRYGGGLYVVYTPDRRRGDPAAQDTLHWIQVVALLGSSTLPPMVDMIGRANPFYVYGGLASINGAEVVNFHDIAQIGVMGETTIDTRFLAETFLARDTGRKTASGKTIVTIFGGIRYGWQACVAGASR